LLKNIAVLVHSMVSEYATTVITGIYNYFKDNKDVALYIIQSRNPHYIHGISEYQYWSGAEYVISEEIDGVIIVPNTYNSFLTIEEIRTLFSIYKDKTLVSIGMDLGIPNSYYTIVKPDDAYDEIIGFLKNQKGRKNIAFISANPTGSTESLARFEAYKKALKKHGLKYQEENTLHGFFTFSSAKDALEKKFHSKNSNKKRHSH